MTTWWASLSGLEHVLLYIALPSTLLLLIQTILLFLGGMSGGELESGVDTNADPSCGLDCDHDTSGGAELQEGDVHTEVHDGSALAGLHIFTLRGIIAFLTLFGWGGLWLSHMGLRPFWALFLAIQMGIIGMVGIALLLREALHLQYDGTLNPRNAVGLCGTVYLTIPAGRAAPGKVNVLVQDQLREFDALTEGDAIPTGAEIQVIGIAEDDALLVMTKQTTEL